jgi:hypothetical protein
MTTLRSRRFAAIGVVLAATVVSAALPAHAQTAEAPSARADRLFREGKQALEAGRFADACPKLAESQRLDPGMGTLLALALCHEGNGQLATAYREFHEVASAPQARADRATLANQHLKTLEPRLSTLTLTVPDDVRATTQVRIDGVDVPASTWANPIPTDPGDHVVEAQAAGGAPWRSTVHLDANHDNQVVSVPAAAKPEVAPPPPAPEPQAMEPRHKLGWIVGGAGGVLLATGSVMGGLALSEHSTATGLCPRSPCGNAAGVADNNTAKTYAWVSDFGIVLGLAGLGTAAYLLLTHDDAHPAASPTATGLRVSPTVGPGLGGLSFAGAW